MQLSVIIPTYNRRKRLFHTLQTIFQQTCSPNGYEIVVVVDGSTDGTAEMLRQLQAPCKFQILEQPNRGQAAARNAGVGVSSGDLILFLDDDMLCDPSLVAEHFAAHQSGDDEVVFGPVYVAPESHRSLATRRIQLEAEAAARRLHREEPSLPFDAVVGANSSVRRGTFAAFGGFDETFYHAREDVELGLRFWRAGVQFRYREAAAAYQVYTKTNKDLVRGDGAAYGKHEVRLYRKHPHLRRYSEFAHYSEDGWSKRLVRELVARMAAPLEPPAAAFCWLAEHLPEKSVLENIGLRILAIRRNAMMLRNAVAEAGGWRTFQREFGLLVPALLFHNVGPYPPGTERTLTIPPRKFEKFIRWLRRQGYVGIRCVDWLLWLRGEKVLPDKSVVLTFDDAYTNLTEYALPVLKHYGFSATVFVVADQIGRTNTWDESQGSATLHCMTAERICQWSAEGFEFGAHTRTHADLKTLSDADLANEVDGSARDLLNLLGTRVHSFAYPYGDYSEPAKKRVEEVFDLAFTCDEGLNGLGTDPSLLRRTMVRPNDTLLDLAFYLKLGSTPVNHLRDLWHRFRPVNHSRGTWQPPETSLP